MAEQSSLHQQPVRPVDEKVMVRARRWVTLLASDTVTEADKAAFESWRRADLTHEIAYQEADRVWSGLPQLQDLHQLLAEKPGPLQRMTDFFRTLWVPVTDYPLMTGAALVALVLIAGTVFFSDGISGFRSGPTPPAVYSYATDTGEIKDISLPDGSEISLSARSSVRVEYSPGERRVLLEQGEALFTVVGEPQRPFVVVARNAQARVLGTVFSVRRGTKDIFIAVKTGQVRVASLADPGQSQGHNVQSRDLAASQGISVMLGGELGNVRVVSANTLGAWRSGRLYYQDAPLSEVVADANRFFDKEIILGSSAIADLRVTAAFSTAAIDQLIENITYLLPVQAEQSGTEKIVLLPADRK